MESNLTPLPSAPQNVSYALTVPQSVLFAWLSLDGSREWAFRETMGITYEPDFIAIDNGAMSWACNYEPRLIHALGGTQSALMPTLRFLETMERTARRLEWSSTALARSSVRRTGSVEDLVDDLREYWHAYKCHMTSLFTFWNIEFSLSADIAQTTALESIDLATTLARFYAPSDDNYFVLERRELSKIASRFGLDISAQASRDAYAAHADLFGFVLAPFNIGNPPTAFDSAARASDLKADAQKRSNAAPDVFDDLPANLRLLGLVARQIAFWKTHRIDVFSLADRRVSQLFEEAADRLMITLDQLFAMTEDEVLQSLLSEELCVPLDVIADRRNGFCIALTSGRMAFYLPSVSNRSDRIGRARSGDTISGTAAAAGTCEGKVRLILSAADASALNVGEVLLTKMTRPEMGAALDRAAAFVTDEGGLMCHAAIISREMRKPCVIGTGTATTQLRTGDIVRVDGDVGSVTVLETSTAAPD